MSRPPMISIRQTEGKLEIVDQLLLPHTTAWVAIESPKDAFEAIKSMKVCHIG